MTAFPGYPPAPQYPTAPPVQQFPQQPQGYPPQQYAQPQQFPVQQGYPQSQMAPPGPTLATGTLDDFFSQPSAGGGKSLSFHQKPYGTRYIGIVTRPLGPGDVQQQTDTMQRPQFFKDGRPKFVMKVPLQMQPSAEYPDGLATWFVKGQARDELVRAMAEAGAPAGPPEANSIIQIDYVGERQSGAGMNPAKQFQVVYTRPDGQTSSPVPQQAPAAPQPAAQPQYAPPAPQQPDMEQAVANMQQGFPQAQVVQQPQPQYQPQPPAPQQAAPAQQPLPVQQPAQPGYQMPADFTPDQQALMARLTGAQTAS